MNRKVESKFGCYLGGYLGGYKGISRVNKELKINIIIYNYYNYI
jgi:hypothetical protein